MLMFYFQRFAMIFRAVFIDDDAAAERA